MKANPCPRCGHEPHVVSNIMSDGRDKWQVKCAFCGLRSSAKRKRLAIRQWNRTIADPLTPLERGIIEFNQILCILADRAGCFLADFSDAVRSAFSEGDEK